MSHVAVRTENFSTLFIGRCELEKKKYKYILYTLNLQIDKRKKLRCTGKVINNNHDMADVFNASIRGKPFMSDRTNRTPNSET